MSHCEVDQFTCFVIKKKTIVLELVVLTKHYGGVIDLNFVAVLVSS